MNDIDSIGEVAIFAKVTQESKDAGKVNDQNSQRDRLYSYPGQPRLKCKTGYRKYDPPYICPGIENIICSAAIAGTQAKEKNARR